MKYWDRYTDGAFENMLLLYSRKYGTNHYAVFHAVKIGRLRNWKDEELLHAVLANVAQGYYYSITGDLYLQRAWKQLKLKMEPATPEMKALPAPAVKKAKLIKQRGKKTAAKKIGNITEVSSHEREEKQAEKSVLLRAASASHTAISKSKNIAKTADAVVPESKKSVKTVVTGSKPEVSSVKSAVPIKSLSNQPASVQIYPINSSKELPMSIAETVKKVTGKSYGIYRELFFREVRSAIRTILQHSAIQKLSFFGSEQNDAENIIYEFLETNYDNPYQQWQGSTEQSEVSEQGFRIDSLEPIIRLWAKENI